MRQSKPTRKKATVRKVGRPKTRAADYHQHYRQHSVWLPNALYSDVLRGLVTPEGKSYEFAKLVESLLRQWLREGAKLPKD